MSRVFFLVAALAASSSVASAQTVSVTLSEWKIRLAPDTVRAGRVTFEVINRGTMNHALHVMGDSIDQGTREIASRQTASLTVTLKPGTYEVFCPMSEESHKKAGMSRTLIVTSGGTPAVPKKVQR